MKRFFANSFAVMLVAMLCSGCGFASFAEQMKEQRKAVHYQHCDKKTTETTNSKGEPVTKESTHCKQWRE